MSLVDLQNSLKVLTKPKSAISNILDALKFIGIDVPIRIGEKASPIATSIVQGIASSVASVAATAMNPILKAGGQPTLNVPASDQGKFKKAVFGDYPVQDIPTRIAETKKKAEEFGLGKASGLGAGALVLGTIGLDLTGFGGARKGLVSVLTKTKDVGETASILRKAGVAEDLVKEYAPIFAKSSDAKFIAKGVDTIAETQKATKVATLASKTLSQGQKTESALPPAIRPTASPSGFPKDISSTFKIPQHSGLGKPPLISESIDRLTLALKAAKPVRKEQEALYAAERGKRFGEMSRVRSETGGEAGFYKELGTLKGELPKSEFESLRNKISQADIDNIFNAVVQTKRLSELEKLPAREGLLKMLSGKVPTENEIKLLSQVLPPEAIKALLDTRGFWAKVADGTLQALNIPPSLLSSANLSP